MDVLSLEEVLYNQKGALTRAVVKMASSGIGIKPVGGSEIKTIKADEIKELQEFYGVVAHSIRITKKDGAVFILDGITPDDLESVKQYVKKTYKLNIYGLHLAVDGNVHGKIDVSDAYIEMKVGDKTLLEVPLEAISNVYERRGEGIIDIDESHFGVTEIRFASLGGEGTLDVPALVQRIKSATDTHSHLEILSLEEVTCVLPRGKSKLTLTSTSLHLIGKTYSHHVLFGSIAKIYYLERSREEGTDEMSYVILELSTPIRQGQTRYHFIILLFPEDSVKIALGKEGGTIEYSDEEGTGEQEVADKDWLAAESRQIADLGLQPTYEGTLSECIVAVLTKLSGTPALTSGSFSTMSGGKALKCSSKANEGYLYPLSSGLLFVSKITFIKYEDISVVEFSRVNLSSRTAKTFDARVVTRDHKEFMFNGIQKAEFSVLEGYLSRKGVKCQSEVVSDAWHGPAASAGESEDEETASDDTSEDEGITSEE